MSTSEISSGSTLVILNIASQLTESQVMAKTQTIIFEASISIFFQIHQLTIKDRISSTNRDSFSSFSFQMYSKLSEYIDTLSY